MDDHKKAYQQFAITHLSEFDAVCWDGYKVGRNVGTRTGLSDQERALVVRECIDRIEDFDSKWHMWRAIGMLCSISLTLTEVNDEPARESETNRTETGGQPS